APWQRLDHDQTDAAFLRHPRGGGGPGATAMSALDSRFRGNDERVTGQPRMQFGEVPVATAEGAILVHSLRLAKSALRKGRVLSAADITEIAAAGIDEITVVRLEPGDVREDAAADRIAAAVAGPGIALAPAFTGRANL